MWFNYGLVQTFIILYMCILPLLAQGSLTHGCDYFEDVKFGQSYHAYSPRHPNNYKGENHCVWHGVSQKTIRLICRINIPWSCNCNEDHLSIEFADAEAVKYCGIGTFGWEGKNSTIRFNSAYNTQGGRFYCVFKTRPDR